MYSNFKKESYKEQILNLILIYTDLGNDLYYISEIVRLEDVTDISIAAYCFFTQFVVTLTYYKNR